jgi:hypothetical protein
LEERDGSELTRWKEIDMTILHQNRRRNRKKAKKHKKRERKEEPNTNTLGTTDNKKDEEE